MKVYGYARVSTEEQVKSGSLDQQVEKIKDYCDSQDHELEELFTDAGVSALKERPEFEKMMETIEVGKGKNQEVDGIVVTKLDRFGRSVKDLVMNMETLQEEEVDFIPYLIRFRRIREGDHKRRHAGRKRKRQSRGQSQTGPRSKKTENSRSLASTKEITSKSTWNLLMTLVLVRWSR